MTPRRLAVSKGFVHQALPNRHRPGRGQGQPLARSQRRYAAVAGPFEPGFFEPQELVVFGQPFGIAHRADLDLPARNADCQISEEIVLGLPRPCRDNRRIPALARRGDGIERAGTCAILITLISAALAAPLAMPRSIRDGWVANRSSPTSWMRPRLAVIAGQWLQSSSPRPSSIDTIG